jgi:hypothetical protein
MVERQASLIAFDEIKDLRIGLTVLLCSSCRALDRLGYDFDENPALSQWWEKHQSIDRGAT